MELQNKLQITEDLMNRIYAIKNEINSHYKKDDMFSYNSHHKMINSIMDIMTELYSYRMKVDEQIFKSQYNV